MSRVRIFKPLFDQWRSGLVKGYQSMRVKKQDDGTWRPARDDEQHDGRLMRGTLTVAQINQIDAAFPTTEGGVREEMDRQQRERELETEEQTRERLAALERIRKRTFEQCGIPQEIFDSTRKVPAMKTSTPLIDVRSTWSAKCGPRSTIFQLLLLAWFCFSGSLWWLLFWETLPTQAEQRLSGLGVVRGESAVLGWMIWGVILPALFTVAGAIVFVFGAVSTYGKR